MRHDPEPAARRGGEIEGARLQIHRVSIPRGIDFGDKAPIHALAKKLDASGAVLREAGQVLTYHNHAIEFVKFDGKLALEIIYEESDPQNLQAEIDTYWVQYGGGNPVEWCRRMAGRLPLLHMKDYMFLKENKHEMAEIGVGNLDWKAIIPAAEKSGCEWFIVEQDYCPGDPFDSLKASFDYIAANLVGGVAALVERTVLRPIWD